MDSIRANFVLAVSNNPHGGKPLIQPNNGVLEDRSLLYGEQGLGVPSLALPEAARGHKRYFS
jgi:hypothetical protein